MKKTLFTLIILLFTSLTFSQQQYQGLLWEISGNGLQKSSYLYGTMHVSRKVAFRLDDVFYEALNKSDAIALESDPTTWLQSTYESFGLQIRNTSGSYKNNFYSNLFKLNPTNEVSIRNAIRFDNAMINGYLYRKNKASDNFEEETYLDMFIYQAGKKTNKPIIGLEDINESRYLTTKAKHKPNKKKMDDWLIKRFAKEGKFSIHENAYRDRNLDLLDSLGFGVNTEYFREHMLFKRNANMVVVLDSVMQNKSVFSGVGAAHLPGNQGMINMLRKKGYTVKSLESSSTDYGKSEKARLDNLFLKPSLSIQTTPDKFISIKSFDSLREFAFKGQKYYVAPDMSNGAFLTITRLNTIPYLPNKKEISWERINSLLYEDIPGEIIKKQELTHPFKGVSIVNKTKKGDYQKYHIYKTPLEIIVIKFGGKKKFVLDHEQEIFGSLKFNISSDTLIPYSSPKNKYEFLFPNKHISNNLNIPGKKLLQGVLNDSYFFFEECVLNDINYIEEDAFEAKYINQNFIKELQLEEASGGYKNSDYKSYESTAVIDSINNTKLFLKSIVKDGSYYLMGYVGNNTNLASNYFTSFKASPINYEGFKIVKDTSLHFTVNTVTNPPYPLRSNGIFGSFSKKRKSYEENIKKTTYTTPSNEQVYVTRHKFHDLFMIENIDSLWRLVETGNIDKIASSNFRFKRNRYKNFKLSDRKKTNSVTINEYSFALKDTGSSKKIIIKNILRQGVLFQLKTLTDSIAGPSKFVTEFYNSFVSKDTLSGKDIFEDKSDLFLEALKRNDSIALKSHNIILFNNQDAAKIINLLDNHEFEKDWRFIKTNLINKLGKLENEKILPFFKHLYKKSYTDPKTQSDILNALSNKKTKLAYKTVLELLDFDIPISRNWSNGFRYGNKDTLQLNKQLFPDLLKFSSVAEYKDPIYEILAKSLDSSIVKPKVYKRYLQQITTDAKVEIKRNLSRNNSNNSYNQSSRALENYLKLLLPYNDHKNVKEFLEKLLKIDDTNVLSSYYVHKKKHNEKIPQQLEEKTFESLKAYSTVIAKLDKAELLSVIAASNLNQERYAKSKLFTPIRYDEAKDSIIKVSSHKISMDDEKEATVYFYKLKKITSYGESESLQYIAFIIDEKKILTTKEYYRSTRNGIRLNNSIKTEKELIEEVLELVKHKKRKRITKRYY